MAVIVLAGKHVDCMYFEKLDMESHAQVDKNANNASRWNQHGDVKPAPTVKVGVEAARNIQEFVVRYFVHKGPFEVAHTSGPRRLDVIGSREFCVTMQNTAKGSLKHQWLL